MGETQQRPFQLSFNTSLKVEFQGSRVTSDGGLVLVRELDERLGFGELVDRHLSDSRRGKNIQLLLADRSNPARQARSRHHILNLIASRPVRGGRSSWSHPASRSSSQSEPWRSLPVVRIVARSGTLPRPYSVDFEGF